MEEYIQKRNKYVGKIRKRLDTLAQTDQQYIQMGGVLKDFDIDTTNINFYEIDKFIDSVNTDKKEVFKKFEVNNTKLKEIIDNYEETINKLKEANDALTEANSAMIIQSGFRKDLTEKVRSSAVDKDKIISDLNNKIEISENINKQLISKLQIITRQLVEVSILNDTQLKNTMTKLDETITKKNSPDKSLRSVVR